MQVPQWGLQIRWSAVQLNEKQPDTTTFANVIATKRGAKVGKELCKLQTELFFNETGIQMICTKIGN